MTQAPVSLVRKMYYDVSDDGEMACGLIGLPAMSPDIAEAEQKGSEQRMERIKPVVPTIDALSQSLSMLAVETMIFIFSKATGAQVEVDPMQKAEMLRQHQDLIHKSTKSIVSVLVDEGMLVLPDKKESPDGLVGQ